MDYAQCHHGKLLHNLCKKINVFYNPPYSPFLNPIEEVFGLFKYYLRKSRKINANDLTKQII